MSRDEVEAALEGFKAGEELYASKLAAAHRALCGVIDAWHELHNDLCETPNLCEHRSPDWDGQS